MKIVLARHYGVCFGVRDAIRAAEAAAARGPVTILGELVHNPAVNLRLAGLGATQTSLDQPSAQPAGPVMITAHGASDRDRAAWAATGRPVLDTTCPLVHRAHASLRALVAEGRFPVVIGRRDHVEVRGLTGDFPESFVLESEAQACDLPVRERYGIVSQTTQPFGFVKDVVEAVRRARPWSDVRFLDTVCQPTKDRQHALDALCREADTVVVVGGRNSHNTRRLVETARARVPRVWHVEAAAELQPRWFVESGTVGVTAGTSTTEETVREVVARLERFAAAQRFGFLTGTGTGAPRRAA